MKKLRQSKKKRNYTNLFVLVTLIIGVGIAVSVVGQQQSLIQRAQTPPACTASVSAADMNHIDSVVRGVMQKDAIPGLSVAITKDGKLVYAKGYGVADKSTGAPVTTASRFRVASLSKSFTSAGIIKLTESGRINLDQKVFGPGSILGTTYTTRPRDPRINNITIRQLLTHTSGMWGSDASDPMAQNFSFSQSQLITSTLEGRTLPVAPGTTYLYSNFGYLILGRVIEKVTGQPYETWTRANVLTPVGITSMQIAGSTLAERASDEVVYYPGVSQTLSPYAINVRRMDSHGGWIATPTDIVRFMVRMDGFSSPADFLTAAELQLVTTPTAQSLTALGNNTGYGMGWNVRTDSHAWWHTGVLPGTATIMVRRPEGFTWAVLTNTDGSAVNADIDQMMYTATQGVTSWPACDLFSPVTANAPTATQPTVTSASTVLPTSVPTIAPTSVPANNSRQSMFLKLMQLLQKR